MDTLSTIFNNHIGFPFSEASLRSRKKVLRATIEYLLHAIDSSEYTNRVYSELNISSGIAALRAELTNSGYILKYLKLYFIQPNKEKKFPVKAEDKKLYDLIGVVLRSYINTWLSKHQGMPVWTPKRFDAFLRNTYGEIYPYTKRFVLKKMSFILRSERKDADDLVYDLMFSGIRGILMAYPQIESTGHTKAFMKRSIHNHGINIIHYFAHPDRTRYIRKENGEFEARVLSIHAIEQFIAASGETSGRPGELSAALDVGYTGNPSPIVVADQTLTINSLNKKVKGMAKKKRICYKLLKGQPSQKFTAWLNENYKEQWESNVELFEASEFDDYVEIVSDYLGISVPKITEFLHSLAA